MTSEYESNLLVSTPPGDFSDGIGNGIAIIEDPRIMSSNSEFMAKMLHSPTSSSKKSTKKKNQQAISIPVVSEGDTDEQQKQLEIRRQRNRESMRRVRLRKRDARHHSHQLLEHLELQLQQLMEKNRHDAELYSRPDNEALAYPPGQVSEREAALGELLTETVMLSDENTVLRERIKTQQYFQAATLRMTDEELADLKFQTEEEARQDDLSMLSPLLKWLNDIELQALMRLASQKIYENAALIESLVPRGNYALGWSDKRCVEGQFARYLMSKQFHHEKTDALMQRTWIATTDFKKLSKVIRWANGMKVLYWLSDQAAIVTRELDIPNPLGPDHPTKFRFTLLVYCMPNANGYIVGTINLNLYGSNVEECLERDVTYTSGLNAHTMYGFIFRRVLSTDLDGSEREVGCHVTLAGLTGNGTHVYARNVLMEMITVVLLWENAFVGPILRLTG